jgi:hypothetical protein
MKFTLPATDVAADAGTALNTALTMNVAQTISAAKRSPRLRLLLENDEYM